MRAYEDARVSLDVMTESRDRYRQRAENHWQEHHADQRKTRLEAAEKIRQEAEKNEQRVSDIRGELKASRKREANKDKQIQQHNSAIQAVNSAANSAVAAANDKLQKALKDKEKMSIEKGLNDKQVLIMQKEVERL